MGARLVLRGVLFLACSIPQAVVAEAVAGGGLNAQANAAYDAQDWAKAARLYGELSIQQKPAPPRVFVRLGESLRALGKYEEALAAFAQADKAGGTPLAEFGAATIYALKKQRDQALSHLEKAVASGFNQSEKLTSQTELASLRGDPRFTKLQEQTRRNERPCAYKAENRQFDFWVGDWNVETTQGGVPAGTSRIERILGDCVVLENWSSLGTPYSGKSYNTYNAALKRWEQFWVDNSGGTIFFHGGLKDGVMDYYTDELPQPDGTKLKRHLQFFNQGPDKVRQYSQGSTDGGKTWKPEYDFTYLRKK